MVCHLLSDRCPVLSCPQCPVLSVLTVTLVYCGQTVAWIKMKLGMEVGLGPGQIVLDHRWRPSSPPLEKKRHSPLQFLAHVRCGQTDGCIKMPLGTKVGLSPGHIVLDGDPAPPARKGAQPPNFRSMSIVAKRLPISSTAEHLSQNII